MNYSGRRWACDEPYRLRGDTCVLSD